MDLLFIDFLNSDWRDYRVKGRQADRLYQPEWWASFLQVWPLLDSFQMPDNATLATLAELRALLLRLITSFDGEDSPAESDLAALDSFLGRVAVQRRLEWRAGSYRLRLEPARRDWDWLLSEIAASFVILLVEGTAERVKICQNPDCRWVFYDASKNRTHRWCEQSTCANLMKVRRYRSRQREKAGE